MITKKVIKAIKKAKAEVEWSYPKDHAEDFKEVILALEKELPLEPRHQEPDKFRCTCPACHMDIDTSRGEINGIRIIINYCPHCGQALKV